LLNCEITKSRIGDYSVIKNGDTNLHFVENGTMNYIESPEHRLFDKCWLIRDNGLITDAYYISEGLDGDRIIFLKVTNQYYCITKKSPDKLSFTNPNNNKNENLKSALKSIIKEAQGVLDLCGEE